LSAQSDFSAKVNALIAQSRLLPEEARNKVLELLNEARIRVVADLSGMNPESFSAAQLRSLKASIDVAFDDFRRQATGYVQAAQAKSANLGLDMVNQPIEAVVGPLSLGQVSTSTLAIAQGYTADLITGLSHDAAMKVNAVIQRAFLGGQSMTDIFTQIGKALGDGDFTGVFGPIGDRAVVIMQNEILRVQSLATQARMQDLLGRHPDLQKQWWHIPASIHPRPLHLMAHGQVVNVDQPFDVGGEELMFPRDPSGSAENTINCHCLSRPYFSPAALKASPEQRGLLDSLGIKVTVKRAA
jgi:hypothetical protein